METQLQNAPRGILKGTPARIVVALLLALLALPLFYLGLIAFFAFFRFGYGNAVVSTVSTLTPVFGVLSAFGTLLSFRHALITVAALAVFYLGWAFTVYPFGGFLPSQFLYWARVIMLVMLSLNLAWIVWSFRTRLALPG